MSTPYEDALECECFITGDYCLCEEGCECGCPDCDCDNEIASLLGGCPCGGNCMCNANSEDEGGNEE